VSPTPVAATGAAASADLGDFVLPYAIVFGTAAVIFVAWLVARRGMVRLGRWSSGRVIGGVRRYRPPAGVAERANAWSCGRCRSVNRPDATVCYSCRGPRSEVEHLQGRI
jgi:hypothetical protein